MKNIDLHSTLFFFIAAFLSLSVCGQNFKDMDASPHDIVYSRDNKISPPSIKVLYGRPQKKGRIIFGELIPYGKIWRVGANEATEIRFYNDVVFGDANVKAGTYVLYAIPNEKEWTLILNSNIDVWGASDYNKEYDVARTQAKVSKAEMIETFSIGFKNRGKKTNMVLAWDVSRITLPITVKK